MQGLFRLLIPAFFKPFFTTLPSDAGRQAFLSALSSHSNFIAEYFKTFLFNAIIQAITEQLLYESLVNMSTQLIACAERSGFTNIIQDLVGKKTDTFIKPD